MSEEPDGRQSISAGKLALGVAKQLLRPGESIEIRTPNAIAAVRGSAIFVDVGTDGRGAQRTVVATLHVSLPVDVSGGTAGVAVGLASQQITGRQRQRLEHHDRAACQSHTGPVATITQAFKAPSGHSRRPTS